jgi:hypothetical protein
VISGWKNEGCFDEIGRQLGYRFRLVEGVFANEVAAGQSISVSLRLRNEGWAAPFNPRPVELWLRHITSGALYSNTLSLDPRFWLADPPVTYTVTSTFTTPASMPAGDYELLLKLPDPDLTGRPEYAIRLANAGLWEDQTGFNRLLHTLTVVQPVYLPVVLRQWLW